MRRKVVFLLALLFLTMERAPGQKVMDSYGGWTQLRSTATGWFHTAKLDGRWWLIDPLGDAFLSLGVTRVSLAPGPPDASGASPYREAALQKHGTRRLWAASSVRRLRGWGFNTVGAGSDRFAWRQDTPYTVDLDLVGALRQEDGVFPDVFSGAFEREAQAIARNSCHALAGDPVLLGYFTDSDLPWGDSPEQLFVSFLRLSDFAPGRAALLGFLEDRYLEIEQLNEAWGASYAGFAEIGRLPQVGAKIPREDQDDFLYQVADRYFTVAQQAVRAVDANHLLLGCRFARVPPAPVLRALRGHVDVVSLNGLGERPPVTALRETYRLTQLPLLISEFTFRAHTRGPSDAKGKGPAADTQRERGQRYERYLREALSLPMVVGCHWYAHADASEEEGGNCGLVNVADEPYRDFLAGVISAHEAAYPAHLGGRASRQITSAR